MENRTDVQESARTWHFLACWCSTSFTNTTSERSVIRTNNVPVFILEFLLEDLWNRFILMTSQNWKKKYYFGYQKRKRKCSKVLNLQNLIILKIKILIQYYYVIVIKCIGTQISQRRGKLAQSFQSWKPSEIFPNPVQ